MNSRRRVFVSSFLFCLFFISLMSSVFQIDSFWPFSPYNMYSNVKKGVVLYEFRVTQKGGAFETPLLDSIFFGPFDDYMKFSYIIYEQDKPFAPQHLSPRVYEAATKTLRRWNHDLSEKFPEAVNLKLYRVYYDLEKEQYRMPAKRELVYNTEL